MQDAFTFPALGPLLGKSFDQAVQIVVSRWRVFACVGAAAIVGGLISVFVGLLILYGFLIYWSFAALANAVRIFDPAYRMSGGKAATIVGISISVGLLTELGLMAFIIPGIWVYNKYSMSLMIAAVEDKGVGAAITRSWKLTTNAFWPTLWFNVVVVLCYVAVIVVGYVITVGIASFILVQSAAVHPAAQAIAIVLGLCILAIYYLCLAYATQAQMIAQRYWLEGLLRRERSNSSAPS